MKKKPQPTPDEILASLREYRRIFGPPSRMKILRQLVKTRPFTRTVYIKQQSNQ